MFYSKKTIEISIYNCIQSHIVEINYLKKESKTKKCKSAFQRLPRHMRRRAASNNPKRLPKSVQALIQNNEVAKKKRKKRIFRRRNDPRWTILHIWFAKRFKLNLQWNIFVPIKNNVKNQRILYRSTKHGYTVFYLPFIKSFLLEYSALSDDSYFLQFLSKFCSNEDIFKLKNTPSDHSCTILLYEHNEYPFKLIGPCSFTKNKFSSYYLTMHKIVGEILMKEFFKHSNKITLKELCCSHICLIGPKSLDRLNKKLSKQITFDKDFGNSSKCFNITQNITINFTNFLDQIIDSNLKDRLIMLKNYHLGTLQVTEITVPNKYLKKIWSEINVNMPHLVGGIQDLQVMTINTGLLFFPNIGFMDCIFNNNLAEKCPLDLANKYILRNASILNELSEFSLEKIEQLKLKIETDNILIQVMVDYLKGIPRNEDVLVLPKEDAFILPFEKEQDFQCKINENKEPIGIIEYGCYSMLAAKCRAFGIITFKGLILLIKLNKTIRDQDGVKFLYGFTQTIYNHYNPVQITLADSKLLI